MINIFKILWRGKPDAQHLEIKKITIGTPEEIQRAEELRKHLIGLLLRRIHFKTYKTTVTQIRKIKGGISTTTPFRHLDLSAEAQLSETQLKIMIEAFTKMIKILGSTNTAREVLRFENFLNTHFNDFYKENSNEI